MLQRKYIYLANLTLVALLGWAALKIWQTQPTTVQATSVDQTNATLPDSPPNTLPAKKTTVDTETLAQSALFGAPLPATPEKNHHSSTADTDATDSPPKLNLLLKGTVAGSPHLARAIIVDLDTDKTNAYRIGQTVADAQVRHIGPKSVTLCYQGKNITLNLVPDSQTIPPKKNTPAKKKSATPVTHANGTLAQKISSSMVDELLHKAHIQPYLVNGQPQGLRIEASEKLAIASLIGLQSGDVIQVVNGQVLTSKQKAFQVFQKARTQPYIDIELLRGDQTETLTLPLR